MPTFTPPTKPGESRTTPEMNRSETMFWSHFRAPEVGVTVWKLIDGGYTEIQPAAADVAFIYVGGHIWPVSDTEAAALTEAGYGSYIEADG